MKTTRTLALVGAAVIAAVPLAALPAQAKDGDVIRTGPCSGASDWKLKLSPENGKIEAEFEVDSNRAGQSWRVRMVHNGDVVYRKVRVTQAPSGSFTARVVVPNAAGDDVVRGRATNLASGEVCAGRATF